MDNQTPTQLPEHSKKALFMLIGIIGVIFVALFYLVNQGLQQNAMYKKQAVVEPTMTTAPQTVGAMTISEDTTNPSAGAARRASLMVHASSDNHTIVGYDVVVTYDDTNLTFQNAQSMLSDFRVMTFKGKGYIAITGTKAITSQEQTLLNNTPLVRLNFVPKTEGVYNFSIMQSIGKEKTQMIDDQSEILNPAVNSV